MTRIIKATAIAAILAGSVSSAFAMDYVTATKTELLLLGYSDAVVSQLSDSELSTISSAMNSGSDSDARQAVSSLVHHFTE